MDSRHLPADALCDFAEGLMAPADRRAAEEHLAACADCRREAAAMQGYFREMAGLPTLKAPDRFLTKVHARLAKASPWRRLLTALSSPRLLPVPLMGLAILLVGVYFVFLSPRLAERALPTAQVAPAESAPGPLAEADKKQKALRAAPVSEAPQAGAAGAAQHGSAAPAVPAAEAPQARGAAEAPARPAAPEAAAAPAPGRPSIPPKGERRPAIASRVPSERAAPKSAPPGSGGSDAGKEQKLAESSIGRDAQSAVKPRVKAEAAKTEASASGNESRMASADAETDGEAVARAPGRRGAAPAPAPETEGKGSRPQNLMVIETEDERSFSDEAAPYPKEAASAAAAPPATTPKPWAPLGYTLKARVSEASLRGGLKRLEVKVLRQDFASGRYELEIPSTRVSDLETYLRGLGALTPSPRPLPGPKHGAPIRLTLKIAAP